MRSPGWLGLGAGRLLGAALKEAGDGQGGPTVSIWAAGLSVALRNQRLHSCRTGGETLISTVGGLWDPFPQPWLCTEKALKT